MIDHSYSYGCALHGLEDMVEHRRTENETNE